MRRGAQQRVKFGWAILSLLLALGALPGSAEEARFTSLTVEDLLFVRFDPSAAGAELSLPASGLVLGIGSDLLVLGGDMTVQGLPSTLALGLEVRPEELATGGPIRESQQTFFYLLTAFLDNKEAMQGLGPVQVSVGPRQVPVLRWRVGSLMRSLAGSRWALGYRIYRFGPVEGGNESLLGSVALAEYRKVAEISLADPAQTEVEWVDDGTSMPGGESPTLRPGGSLQVAQTLLVGGLASFAGGIEASTLRVIGALAAGSTATFQGDVVIEGNLDLRGKFIYSGTVTGPTTINAPLEINGPVVIGGSSPLQVSGGLGVGTDAPQAAGDVAIAGALRVAGPTTLDSPLKVNSSLTLSADASIAGSLGVGTAPPPEPGGASIAGALTVGGPTSFSSSVTIHAPLNVEGMNNVEIGGGLGIGVAAPAQAGHMATAGNVNIGGELLVVGKGTIQGGTILGATLDVGGLVTLRDALSVAKGAQIGGALTVGGSTTLKGALSVAGDTDLEGKLTVSKDLTVQGNLVVKGTLTYDDLQIKRNADVRNILTVGSRLGIATTAPAAALDVAGSAILGSLPADTVTLNAATLLAPNNLGVAQPGRAPVLFVNTAAGLVGINNPVPASALDVGGTLNVSGAMNVGAGATVQALGVNRPPPGAGDMDVAGNASIGRTLNVAGATTLAGTLTVAGTTTLSGATTINNTLTVNSTLTVGPFVTTLGGALNVTGGTALGGTLTVTGATTLGGPTTVNNTLTVGAFATKLGGTLSVTGTTTLAGNLTVTGATTLSGALTVAKAVTLSDALTVAKATTLNDTLTVSGAVTLSDALTVAKATTLNDTLTVAKAVTLRDSLAVAKAVTLSDALTVAKAASLGATLDVGGLVTLRDALSVAKGAQIGGALTVGGSTTLKGALSVAGDTDLEGKLTVSKDLTVQGNLVVKGTLTYDDLQIKRNADVRNILTVGSRLGIATTAPAAALDVAGSAILGSLPADTVTLNAATLLAPNNLGVAQPGRAPVLFVNTAAGLVGINNPVPASALDVGGTLNVSGAMNVGAGATVQALGVNRPPPGAGDMDVAGNASIGRTLNVAGATTLAGTLTVAGTTTLSGATTINNTLTVNSTLTVGPFVTTLGGALNVTGGTALGGTLTVTGATTLGGPTTVNNTLTVGAFATKLGGTLSVTGTTTLAGNLTVAGTTTLGGATTINSALTVSGSAALKDKLTVAKATTLQDSLDVAKAVTLNDTLTVGKSAALKGALTVDELATFRQDVSVERDLTVRGTLTAGTMDLNDLTLRGSLHVSGDTSLAGRLIVAKDAELMSGLVVVGDASFDNDATVRGKLTVMGQVFADWLVVGEPGFQNAWSFINPDNGPDLALGPVDPTNLAKLTLTVLEFNRATGLVTVTNDLEVGKGLTVFGAAELTGDVLVGGKLDTLGLLTARTARVTYTLRVDGATTLAADASVGQHLEVGGDADILGALTVADKAELMSTLQVGSWMKSDSFAFAKWLVIGQASGNLANSWGIVRTPGDGAGTLTIGAFVTAAEAEQGKIHVPVLSMTSASMTANWPTTFLRGVTVGREEAPANLVVYGNLTVSGIKFFAQEYPGDPGKVIAYASLEGPEAGTYIRGTAQLHDGVAVIELPEHFALVTSEEGLTAQVTPLEECNGLYVAEKSPQRIVVRELLGGKSNARFDYLVQGVRKGYEGLSPVRANTEVTP
jgi:UDP-3-O-[3-hydroxymyristoyl] glucosamine N-acyltransferase